MYICTHTYLYVGMGVVCEYRKSTGEARSGTCRHAAAAAAVLEQEQEHAKAYNKALSATGALDWITNRCPGTPSTCFNFTVQKYKY
jgi:hypothetical protein